MGRIERWLFVLLAMAAVSSPALFSVNRNTAIQVWHKLNPTSVPKGGLIIIGAVRRPGPHNYDDTWFSRYRQFDEWYHPRPLLQVTPAIIVEDEADTDAFASKDIPPSINLSSAAASPIELSGE